MLLLDTHVLLWWRENHPGLAAEVRRAVSEADRVFVSAATAWEVAIKAAMGKLRIPGPLAEALEASDFTELPIEVRHTLPLESLPPHHRDPFDRMLIAQAMVEGLTIVTHDRRFGMYDVPVLWT